MIDGPIAERNYALLQGARRPLSILTELDVPDGGRLKSPI
jgi:hypothetical protein